MDFLEYANQEAQSAAIKGKMTDMFGTEEDERAERSDFLASDAKRELTEVNAALVTAKDDVVANIQEIWDFTKHITSDVGHIAPDDIMEQLAKIRQNQEGLRQRLETLRGRHAMHNRAAQHPEAAADALLRKFPALNKTGVALGEPVSDQEVAEVDQEPNLLPTGQRTRRKPVDLQPINKSELVRKFPALRR